MESEPMDTKKPVIDLKALRSIGNGLIDVRMYSLFLAFMLIGIWCLGRVFEALSRTPVFESDLVYWMALFIWGLLGVFVAGAAIQYTRNLSTRYGQYNIIISWVFFGFLLAGALYITRGYRIAVMGLFASVAGITESARQAVFLLFKLYPATPILPINLVAAKAAREALEVNSLMPFVWSLPCLFGVFIWSLAYGTVLLMSRGMRFSKVVHLLFSLAGLLAMMTIKATSTFTTEQLIFLHAGAVIVVFLQILLTYSSVRNAATKKVDAGEVTRKALPPSGLKLALFLLVVLPILADLQNQFALASNTRPVLRELAGKRSVSEARYVTVTQVSIRSGPALGDDIVGVLPKGTYVPVLKEEHGCVCFGENRWVSLKYLRPVEKG